MAVSVSTNLAPSWVVVAACPTHRLISHSLSVESRAIDIKCSPKEYRCRTVDTCPANVATLLNVLQLVPHHPWVVGGQEGALSFYIGDLQACRASKRR
jgi:hypothetical protein